MVRTNVAVACALLAGLLLSAGCEGEPAEPVRSAAPPQTEAAAPPDLIQSELTATTYVNEYFNFGIRHGADWTVVSGQEIERAMTEAGMKSPRTGLLRLQLDDVTLRFDAEPVAIATQTGHDYLAPQEAKHENKPNQTMRLVQPLHEYTCGGRKLARYDLEDHMQIVFYFTQLAFVERGYVISIGISSTTRGGLDDAMEVVDSLTFY